MADDIKSSLPELKLLSSAELRDTSVLESNDLVGALRENDAYRHRNTVGDSAVGILDTLQSLGSIPLATLPTYELADAVRNSQTLDQLRSPAYLAERRDDAARNARVTAEEGEVAGFVEAVGNTFSGGNVIADVASQTPYLMIGPAARAMGVASKAAVPTVLGRVATGTGELATINRVAALSGVLEGAGAYGQTYERALQETGDPAEAERQALLAGAFSAGLGTVLGKLTPGFELDPLGRRTNVVSQFLGDAVRPTVSAIGAEVFEEGGMAIGQTVADNVLAGRDPMEGVGAATGEAAVISSLFTGGMRAPGLVRNASQAIGVGLRQGLAAAASGLKSRAQTPEGAAVAAASEAIEATPNSEEVIQSTAAVEETVPDSTGSSGEPAVETTPVVSEASTEENATQPTSYELPVGEVAPAKSADSDVEAVLTANALETRADITRTEDGEVDEAQAKAIIQSEELATAGKIDEAKAQIAQKSDEEIAAAVEAANQGDVEAQQTVQAVAAVNIARLPIEAVPEPLKPLVQELKKIPAAVARPGPTSKTEETREQILNKGWENRSTGKAATRKRGMLDYINGIASALRVEGVSDTKAPIGAATKAAGFLQHLRARGEAFKKAGELVDLLRKPENVRKPEYAEYLKTNYVEVEGTATLDEDGKRVGNPFRIYISGRGSEASRNMVNEVLADVAEAERMWDTVAKTAPQLAAASMERAAAEKAKLDAIIAARQAAAQPQEESPNAAILAEAKKKAEEEAAQKKAETAAEREARREARAEREAIQATEKAEEKRIAKEKAAEEAAEKARIQQEKEDAAIDAAEREAVRAYERDVEARLARENPPAEPVSTPDVGSDSNTAQESAPQPQTQNPLLAVTSWARDSLATWFNIDPANTVDGWLEKFKSMTVTRGEETSTAFDLYRSEAGALYQLLAGKGPKFKDGTRRGILQQGILDIAQSGKEDYLDKPYGVASALWQKEESGKMSVPDEVIKAFAWAGAIVMFRNSAKFTGELVDEQGRLSRDIFKEVWAQDIADVAMTLLGVTAKRSASLDISQGTFLSYGLSTLAALIESQNFDMKENFNPETDAWNNTNLRTLEATSDGTLSDASYMDTMQILVPTESARNAAKNNMNTIDAVQEQLDGERVWEAQSEPHTEVDNTIQYTRTKLSAPMQTALENLQKVRHGLFGDMYGMFTTLGDDLMKQVLTGWYGAVPEKDDGTVPSSVREWLKSQNERLTMEFAAVRKYHELTEGGAKGLFYKYHIGINNRVKTVMGPQNNKFVRDMFSSAEEELDLDNPNHAKYMQMTLAQAFGVKTDINDPASVLREWEKIRSKHAALAKKVWAARSDQAALLAALKENRDKPYSPRELAALLTYGRILAQDGKGTFTNYLMFEIDGKTNGAFNTELFFGLGVRNGANLEQGGLFLDKQDATYETERDRMREAYESDDFYGRINMRARYHFVKGLADLLKQYPNLINPLKGQLFLLEAAGLIEVLPQTKETPNMSVVFNGERVEVKGLPQVLFRRDAGKLAVIPVQYGAGILGIKSQLWADVVRNINLNWIKAKNELDRTTDEARRQQLVAQMGHLETLLRGHESFGMDVKQLRKAKDWDAVRWHRSIEGLASAMSEAYGGEKGRVVQVTDTLVKLTNFAYMMKKVQWDQKLQEWIKAKPENAALLEKYKKTGLYDLSRDEYDRLMSETIDLSFNTLNGPKTVSLNNTDFNPNATSITGLGTSMDANLDSPAPRPVGVSILALLTISGGDASMGVRFFQKAWNATNVFDGIDLKVTDIEAAGTALNEAVWATAGFDILNSFQGMISDMRILLDSAAENEWTALVDVYNSLQPNEKMYIKDFSDWASRFNEAVDEFNQLHREQRTGQEELLAGKHTVYQMGGGGKFNTPGGEVRSSASLDFDFELSLEEDAPRAQVADISEVGPREAGRYPDQYKHPEATRIEDEEGFIDVIMKGPRWRGRNTFTAKPSLVNGMSAGLRRLVKVLQMAADAGVAYDSDKSVHPSAIRMYLRAKRAGIITFESRYSDAELEEKIRENQVLRTDNLQTDDGEPVFRNVRLTGKASVSTVKADQGLKTSFEVNNKKLDRAAVIAALDAMKWKNAIHRTVWKRIRNLLPADLSVELADTEEAWNNTIEQRGMHKHRFSVTTGVASGSFIMLKVASPSVMLHELIHTIFTRHIDNFFSNINQVPVELRGPINDLVQLMERFKKLPAVGRVGFVQRVMTSYDWHGQPQDELGEMLAYVFTEDAVIEELSPGFVQRVINRVKQILRFIIKIEPANDFYNEAMDVFRSLTDSVPADARLVDGVSTRLSQHVPEDGLATLEQLTENAYVDLFQRMAQGQNIQLAGVQRENLATQAMAVTAYNLSPEQQRLFTRVYTLLRVGQRSPELEQFVDATFSKHPQKNLFNKSPDVVAAVMALAAVEPTFGAQLNRLWAGRDEQTLADALIDKALNNAQQDSGGNMLNETISAMLVEKDLEQSYYATVTSRLDRLGNRVMEKLGQKAADAAPRAPQYVDTLLKGIAALTTEKGAAAFGSGLIAAVNTHTDQRWLQDLVAALAGTKGDGRLIYRAHNAMMTAINQTRSMFDNTLPRELSKLFPEDFDGWNTLFEAFGRLDVSVLGSSAAEMYLNDAERRRMITVLESKVDNYIDAQNLGYYLVHRKPKPGIAQELLRNARAIADDLNGRRRTAPDSLVADADQLVTLYAIEYLAASERAKVGQYFRAHPESMDKLVGMFKHVKEAEQQHQRTEYRYVYWKDSLPMSTDPRSSVIIANGIKGAQLEQLGYIKGKKYPQTSGDPESDLYYYSRRYTPPPVFSQGIIATVQQTAMGINYTTAASVTPEVGTMLSNQQVVSYIQRTKGRDSNLVAVFNFQGEVMGYERMLDPTIVRESLKGNNTLLHVSIGKKLGRITEENMARRLNQEAIKLMVNQWKEGKDAGREAEYEMVNSSTDKQVARAWENIPADIKRDLADAFGGPVMVRKDLLSNTVGYHNAGALEIYTGDASLNPDTRKILLGLIQTVFAGPKGTQIFLAAEQALKEGVATAKDLIIVRSLVVAYQNFQSAMHLVIANGVPPSRMAKWYRQGMREVQAYNRLQREVIQLRIQIAGTTDDVEKERLRTVQTAKRRSIERLSIYPLIEAGELSDLPEGLEESPSHSYLGDLAGWMNNHLREKVHPKAPTILANALFAKDSTLHDALSKAIQAGDFLARYAIFQHMVENGATVEKARDEVRDELISYQTNPGRMRASLETYGMIWWSQFTLRAQNVLLNRFRKNPFSFFVSQGLGNVLGTPGPLDGAIYERGIDNSTGLDQMWGSPTATIHYKVF